MGVADPLARRRDAVDGRRGPRRAHGISTIGTRSCSAPLAASRRRSALPQLLDAVGALAEAHPAPALCSWSAAPALHYDVVEDAPRTAVADRVHVTGYVADDELPATICRPPTSAPACAGRPIARPRRRGCAASPRDAPTLITDLAHLPDVPVAPPRGWSRRGGQPAVAVAVRHPRRSQRAGHRHRPAGPQRRPAHAAGARRARLVARPPHAGRHGRRLRRGDRERGRAPGAASGTAGAPAGLRRRGPARRCSSTFGIESAGRSPGADADHRCFTGRSTTARASSPSVLAALSRRGTRAGRAADGVASRRRLHAARRRPRRPLADPSSLRLTRPPDPSRRVRRRSWPR